MRGAYHVFAPLLAYPDQPLAIELEQCVTLAVPQLFRFDQLVEAIAIAGDAVVGVDAAHHPFHPLGVVLNLGHVFAQNPTGDLLSWGRTAAAQQFQPLRGSLRLQHQGLVDVAHAHPLGDVVPEALVGLGVFRHAPMSAPDA